jgi:hypothetical protein
VPFNLLFEQSSITLNFEPRIRSGQALELLNRRIAAGCAALNPSSLFTVLTKPKLPTGDRFRPPTFSRYHLTLDRLVYPVAVCFLKIAHFLKAT